jgi:hypothetical protein
MLKKLAETGCDCSTVLGALSYGVSCRARLAPYLVDGALAMVDAPLGRKTRAGCGSIAVAQRLKYGIVCR